MQGAHIPVTGGVLCRLFISGGAVGVVATGLADGDHLDVGCTAGEPRSLHRLRRDEAGDERSVRVAVDRAVIGRNIIAARGDAGKTWMPVDSGVDHSDDLTGTARQRPHPFEVHDALCERTLRISATVRPEYTGFAARRVPGPRVRHRRAAVRCREPGELP